MASSRTLDDSGFVLALCAAPRSPVAPIVLDLFPSKAASSPVELDEPAPIRLGSQKIFDLKTGSIDNSKMHEKGEDSKLDLNLKLSPPQVNLQRPKSPIQSFSQSLSPPSSSVSSVDHTGPETDNVVFLNSPNTRSMVLVGCRRCLMYLMLSQEDLKCPKCKSTSLLNFLHEKEQ